MSFVWNDDNYFQSSADIVTNGIQIAEIYFPLDAEYPDADYYEQRTKIMKYNKFKLLESSSFNTVFSDAAEWRHTFSIAAPESGWVPIAFKQEVTAPRVYSFKTLYIPFLVESGPTNIDTISNIDIRFNVNFDDSNKYSRRITTSDCIVIDTTISYNDSDRRLLILGFKEAEPILLDDATNIYLSFNLAQSEALELKSCWLNLDYEDFATAVFEKLVDAEIKYVELS